MNKYILNERMLGELNEKTYCYTSVYELLEHMMTSDSGILKCEWLWKTSRFKFLALLKKDSGVVTYKTDVVLDAIEYYESLSGYKGKLIDLETGMVVINFNESNCFKISFKSNPVKDYEMKVVLPHIADVKQFVKDEDIAIMTITYDNFRIPLVNMYRSNDDYILLTGGKEFYFKTFSKALEHVTRKCVKDCIIIKSSDYNDFVMKF